MGGKTIAIILTVHNRKVKTLECLAALFEEKVKFDVYLTDDGCTDGTCEAIESLYPQIQIVKGDGNLFWNRGMYKAFKLASSYDYDFYLWINDDTTFVPMFIEKLLECSASESDMAIICGATISRKAPLTITYGGYTKNITPLPVSDKKQTCWFASGNILLIPRAVHRKVGLNDFYYKHALGDFDYEGRARKYGFKIIQAPNYLGYCERHEFIPKWRNSQISVIKRLKYLYTPTGRNPLEFFYFDARHNGIHKAFLHFFTLHLRCLFPHFFCFNYNEKE